MSPEIKQMSHARVQHYQVVAAEVREDMFRKQFLLEQRSAHEANEMRHMTNQDMQRDVEFRHEALEDMKRRDESFGDEHDLRYP